MPISQTILPEFDHEMANTRKTLERVPDDKFAWKPHEKSMSLGGLSTHLANIPSWTANTFDADELDIAPPGAISNSSASKVFAVQLGMLARCVDNPPSDIDFSCGFHANLSSGTRSNVLRVFAIS